VTENDEQPTPEQRERLQQERAEETIRAVSAGGHPGEEAFKLANQYTDEWLDRAAARVRRLFRRR
jgi:hypothetical protein